MPDQKRDPNADDKLQNLRKPRVLGPVSGTSKINQINTRSGQVQEEVSDNDIRKITFELSKQHILNNLASFIGSYFGSSQSIIQTGLQVVAKKSDQEYDNFLSRNKLDNEQQASLAKYRRLFETGFLPEIIRLLLTPKEYLGGGDKLIFNGPVINRFISEVYTRISQARLTEIKELLQKGFSLPTVLEQFIEVELTNTGTKWGVGKDPKYSQSYLTQVHDYLFDKFREKYLHSLIKQYQGYVPTTEEIAKELQEKQAKDTIPAPVVEPTDTDNSTSDSEDQEVMDNDQTSSESKENSSIDSDIDDLAGSTNGLIEPLAIPTDSTKRQPESSAQNQPVMSTSQALAGSGGIVEPQPASSTTSASNPEPDPQAIAVEEAKKQEAERVRKEMDKLEWEDYLARNGLTEDEFVNQNLPLTGPEEQKLPGSEEKITDSPDNNYNFNSLKSDRFTQDQLKDTTKKSAKSPERAENLKFQSDLLRNQGKLEAAAKAGKKANKLENDFVKYNQSGGDRIRNIINTASGAGDRRLEEAKLAREQGNEEKANLLEKKALKSNSLAQQALKALPTDLKQKVVNELAEKLLQRALAYLGPILVNALIFLFFVFLFLSTIAGIIYIYCKPVENIRNIVEAATLGVTLPVSIGASAVSNPLKGLRSPVRIALEDSGICKAINPNFCSEVSTEPQSSASLGNGSTVCLENQLQGKSDDDKVTFSRASRSGVGTTTVPVKVVKSIIAAGKQAGVTSEVIAFAISVAPTESNYGNNPDQFWQANNNQGYLGLAQIGSSERRNWGAQTKSGYKSDSYYLANPAYQMEVIQVGMKEKINFKCAPGNQSTIYEAAYAWLTCNGRDGNGVSSADYAKAAELNYSIITCNNAAKTADSTSNSKQPAQLDQSQTLNLLSYLQNNPDVNIISDPESDDKATLNFLDPAKFADFSSQILNLDPVPVNAADATSSAQDDINELKSKISSGQIKVWERSSSRGYVTKDFFLKDIDNQKIDPSLAKFILLMNAKYPGSVVNALGDLSHGQTGGDHNKTPLLAVDIGGVNTGNVDGEDKATIEKYLADAQATGLVRKVGLSPATLAKGITTKNPFPDSEGHIHFSITSGGIANNSTGSVDLTSSSCSCPSSASDTIGTVTSDVGGGTVSKGGPFTPEVRAFLDVLAKDEVPNYLTRESYFYGNLSTTAKFTEAQAAAGHPGYVGGGNNVGRYQFNQGDYNDAKNDDKEIKNFLPEGQDRVALYKLKYRNAYQPLLAGNMETAFTAASVEWESVVGTGDIIYTAGSARKGQKAPNGRTLKNEIDLYNQRLQYYKSQSTAATQDISIDSNLLGYTNSPNNTLTKIQTSSQDLLNSVFGSVSVQAASRPTSYSQLGQKHKAFLKEVAKAYDDPLFKDNGGELPAARAALKTMQAAYGKPLINNIISGYRGYNDQIATFFKTDSGSTNPIPDNLIFTDDLVAGSTQYNKVLAAYKARAQQSAPPGFSEHHTGLVFDIASVDKSVWSSSSDYQDLYKWLQQNAGRYGFTQSFPESRGDRFENWHWRYDGTTTGKKLIDDYVLDVNSSKFYTPGSTNNTGTASASATDSCQCLPATTTASANITQSLAANKLNLFDSVQTYAAETTTTPKSLDLSAIANNPNNQAQSIIVQTVADGKVQGYNQDQPPASVASTIKSVVVVVVIEEELKKKNISVDTVINIPKILEGDGENKAGDITIRKAIELMLSESSNTTTNGLVYYFGGGTDPNSNQPKERFTQLMHDYGFNNMRFSKYMNINDGKGTAAEQATTPRLASNQGTAGDVAKATYKVFQDEQKYSIAANALKIAEDQFGIGAIAQNNGFTDVARKWGGTSQVTATVGVYALNNVKYVIGAYVNASQSATGPTRLKSTFEDIFKSLKAGATINPNDTTTASTGTNTNCNNPNTGTNTTTGVTTASMQKMLDYAKRQSQGKKPDGRCLWHVNNWIDDIGYGKLPRPTTRVLLAYQYGEWLKANGSKYGVTNLLDANPNLNPFDAPAGAIVVVSAGSPGTSNPIAGDITIADGQGHFYNGGEMGYQSRASWSGSIGTDNRDGSKGKVIGIFVADQ